MNGNASLNMGAQDTRESHPTLEPTKSDRVGYEAHALHTRAHGREKLNLKLEQATTLRSCLLLIVFSRQARGKKCREMVPPGPLRQYTPGKKCREMVPPRRLHFHDVLFRYIPFQFWVVLVRGGSTKAAANQMQNHGRWAQGTRRPWFYIWSAAALVEPPLTSTTQN